MNGLYKIRIKISSDDVQKEIILNYDTRLLGNEACSEEMTKREIKKYCGYVVEDFVKELFTTKTSVQPNFLQTLLERTK